MTTSQLKKAFLTLLVFLPALAFGQATIFVPADNAVRAQKPNFQILESGAGGQVYTFAAPSLAASLTWALPAAYCTTGQLLGFSNGTGALACIDAAALAVTDTTTIDLTLSLGTLSADVVADSLTDTEINSAAAIAGTKIDPDFGSQNVETTGTVTGSNLSGTNTGDVTLGAIGAVPSANGATLTGQVLNLEPASASFGGVVTTGTQTMAGAKTFSTGLVSQGSLLVSGVLNYEITTDSSTTGSAQTLATPTKTIVRVTNASLASVTGVTAPLTSQTFVLMNLTGSTLDLINLTGTSANQIDTGTGADLTMEEGQATTLVYDLTGAKWRVIGGGGGGGGTALYNNTFTGTSITTTADAFQKWAYTGGSAQTMTAPTLTSMPEGGRVVFTGRSDTNTLTIPYNVTGMRLNGEMVLYEGSVIEFIYDNSELIEVTRNGI